MFKNISSFKLKYFRKNNFICKTCWLKRKVCKKCQYFYKKNFIFLLSFFIPGFCLFMSGNFNAVKEQYRYRAPLENKQYYNIYLFKLNVYYVSKKSVFEPSLRIKILIIFIKDNNHWNPKMFLMDFSTSVWRF